MKTKMKIFIMLFTAIPVLVFSQGNTFKLDGNNNLGNSAFLGSTNAKDLIFKTNSLERMRITGDGQFSINGQISFNKFIYVHDSMRIQGPLFIGDSTLSFWNDVYNGSIYGDQIRSDRGRISFGRDINIFGNHFYSSNIYFGIGISHPNNYKLQIHDQPFVLTPGTLNSVYEQFTNLGFGGIGTGTAVTDGFLVGINAAGTAQLIQQETQDIQFYTAGSAPINSRMIIKGLALGQGFVGIGAGFTLPQSLLHVNDNFSNVLTGEVFRTTSTGQNLNVWRMFTGAGTGTEKFALFTLSNATVTSNNTTTGTNSYSTNDVILQTTQAGGRFIINNGNPNIVSEGTAQSMIIMQNQANGWPRVGIGNGYDAATGQPVLTNPLAHIHIGENVETNPITGNFIGGYRTWMDEGTLIYLGQHYHNITSTTAVDNMFMGLRPIFDPNNPLYEKAEAIINWGNNPSISSQPGQNIHADILRFVFTSDISTIGFPNFFKSGNLEGDEVARMTCDGNNGRMGIGGDNTSPAGFFANPYSPGTGDPARTVEINSPAIDTINIPNISHILNLSLGYLTTNLSGGTGFSGLRFTDLTSNSDVSIDSSGGKILSVNNDGDVILIQGVTGFGAACSDTLNPFNLTDDWRVGLNNHNFYFDGNNAGTAINNVVIGKNCTIPEAKLDVLQASGDSGTIGINVLNTDASLSGVDRSIGIRSIVNQPRNIAGWFNALDSTWTAIYVPENGGKITVGFPVNFAEGTAPSQCLVQIKGNAYLWDAIGTSFITVSDSILKTNINRYSYGLNVVRKVKPITYNYNGKAMLPTNETFLGVSAEDIAAIPEIAPFAVDTIQLFLNTADTSATDVLTINNEAIFYTAVNAIKELDSISTGLAERIDSTFITADNGVTNGTSRNVQLGGSLIKNTEINLNNQSLIFTDPSGVTGNNNIAIGSVLPWAKFSVDNKTIGCAGNFTSSSGLPGWNWGIVASSTNGNPNVGGQFTATDGVYNYGIGAAATGGSYVNFGIRASASGGLYNYAGYFDGDLVYTGNFYKASDSILKENIATFNNAMSLISQLKPKIFNFKTAQYPYLNLPVGTKYGLIAQDVENVIPGIVTTNIHPEQKDINGNTISPEITYKGLSYTDLIPVMIAGMKEQQAVIDSLQSQINNLQSLIGAGQKSTGDNGSNGSQSNMQFVELASENAIILNQNDPNPFAEETNITYFLSDDVSEAKILFYDNNGKIIKTVELIGRGDGTLHVYASNLSAGIYAYALIADGKVIDTKKMVCTKK